MNLVREHCHGYQNCCVCPVCAARSEGIQAGELFYDQGSRLRWRANPQFVGGQAVAAYMRSRRVRQLKAA